VGSTGAGPLEPITLFIACKVYRDARSTKGIVRLSKSERANLTLSDPIKEILVGILLGDAHISRRSPTGNSRLLYTQTAVTHKKYFEYVFSFFISFCTKEYVCQRKTVTDKRNGKQYSSTTFTTMHLPCFNVFKEMFYVVNVKKVPSNIYELLTRRGLAF